MDGPVKLQMTEHRLIDGETDKCMDRWMDEQIDR